jgi:cytochrome c oxidase subunit II
VSIAELSNESTPLHPPVAGWDKTMSRDKRIWMAVLWTSSFILIAISLSWFIVGKQNTPGKEYAITPEAFQVQVKEFVAKYETAPGSGIVAVPPGQDAFLLAGPAWRFYPILKLKAGQPYTIWYSSADVVHNPIIAEQRLSFTAVPGHAYGITYTPDKPGEFLIYCAEYCGIGHQAMATKLIVEP